MRKTERCRLARNKAQAVDWFQDPSLIEVPNPKSSWVSRILRKQRLFRRIIVADIIVAPLVLLLIVLLIFGGNTSSSSATDSSGTNLATPIAYQGDVGIQRWLSSTPAPLPGGHIISYYGEVPVQQPAKPQIGTTLGDYVIASYIVLAKGTFYKASVEEQISGGNTSVISDPSIIPLSSASSVPGAAPTTTSPWPGINATPPPSNGALTQSIQGWTSAFTSGSPSSLALAVGDPNSTDHYVPLSNVAQATPTVLFYATTSKTSAIVEVDLAITWNGESTVKNSNYTYDLLVERPLSAAPVVVAWGPAGSGPSLVPYQNAVK